MKEELTTSKLGTLKDELVRNLFLQKKAKRSGPGNIYIRETVPRMKAKASSKIRTQNTNNTSVPKHRQPTGSTKAVLKLKQE